MKLKSLVFGIALIGIINLGAPMGLTSVTAQVGKKTVRPSTPSTQAKMNFTGTPQARKGVVFATLQKVAIGTLTDGYEVRGKATYTVTASNSDDSFAGMLSYAIPDEARQKIAAITKKPVTAVPASLTVKDVVASLQKGTSCPVVHLEVGPLDVDAVGTKIRFTRKVVLDIQGLEPGTLEKPTPPQEMAMQFCVLTKQINNGGIRRGVIRRMNELINGDDQ